MYDRLLHLSDDHSLFLFGPRNTGKSTQIKKQYTSDRSILIDLLSAKEFKRFNDNPDALYDIVTALPEHITHVIIDEIQKIPALLDVIHKLMSETDKIFIMTGSSARKLKYGGANLLAGRAFVYNLYALSCFELGDDFNIEEAMAWGTLPDAIKLSHNSDKQRFLQAYAHTYLKEEIAIEQLVRQLDNFRKFLEIAAQCNGKIINYKNIANDTGVSDKTVASYYSILEDTLIGFFLEPHHNSLRKRLGKKPKFYFFDPGVVRALTHSLELPINQQTSAYGDAFEHFIILECQRLVSYRKPNYRMSFIRTLEDQEIDLVIERPGKPLLLIEIKSASNVEEKQLRSVKNLAREIPDAEVICLCQDIYPKKFDDINVLPWKMGLEIIFELK